jgi:hypothetical protein
MRRGRQRHLARTATRRRRAYEQTSRAALLEPVRSRQTFCIAESGRHRAIGNGVHEGGERQRNVVSKRCLFAALWKIGRELAVRAREVRRQATRVRVDEDHRPAGNLASDARSAVAF